MSEFTFILLVVILLLALAVIAAFIKLREAEESHNTARAEVGRWFKRAFEAEERLKAHERAAQEEMARVTREHEERLERAKMRIRMEEEERAERERVRRELLTELEEEAERLDPRRREAMRHNSRAVDLNKEGRRREAVVEIRKALELYPEDEIYQRNLLTCTTNYALDLVEADFFEEAEAYLVQLQQEGLEDAFLHLLLSHIYEARGRYDEALAEAKKAALFEPQNPSVRLSLSYSYGAMFIEEDDPSYLREAFQELQKAYRLAPDAEERCGIVATTGILLSLLSETPSQTFGSFLKELEPHSPELREWLENLEVGGMDLDEVMAGRDKNKVGAFFHTLLTRVEEGELKIPYRDDLWDKIRALL